MKCLIAILFLFNTVTSFAAGTIENKWVLRSNEGDDLARALQTKELKDGKLSQKDHCEKIINVAYGMMLRSKAKSFIKAKDIFKAELTLFDFKDGSELNEKTESISIEFIYNLQDKSQLPMAVSTEYILPSTGKNYSLKISPSAKERGVFGISTPTCLFMFHEKDYLHPEVVTN